MQELRSKLASLDNVRKIEERRKQQLETKLAAAYDSKELYEKSIKLCEYCLQEQTEVTGLIAAMVTAILQIFDESLEVRIDTILKPDKVTVSGVRPVAYKNGELDRPSEGQKTGISIGFQATFLKMKPISQVFILDEYFSDVSPTLVPVIVELLRQMGLQIILATHQDIEFPLTYRVYMKGSTSYIEKMN